MDVGDHDGDHSSDADAGAGSTDDASPVVAQCSSSPIVLVDDLADTYRHDFTVDAEGTAYSAVSRGPRVFVRISQDDGARWTDTPDVPYGTQLGRVSIDVSSTGEIFVALMGDDAEGDRRGVLLRSQGPTGPWTVIDEFDAVTVFDLLVTPAGTVVISGVGGTPDTGWFIRSGTTAGTFATTDLIPGGEPGNNDNNAMALAVDDAGNIYAAGVIYDGNNLVWTVRKSTDGVSWMTVDSYESAPQTWALAVGIAIGQDQSVIVTGEAGEEVESGYYNRWLVRRGVAGGGSWQTVHKLPETATDTAIFAGRAIVAHEDGRVFAVGYQGTSNDTGQEFVVLGSTDSGASWNPVTSFPYTAGIESILVADRVALGPDGSLWVSRPDAIRRGCL